MDDETKGDKQDRLDRIEELLEVLRTGHIQFQEEHLQLVKAQVLLRESIQKLSRRPPPPS
ncbi:MAG TPA: hypothetical protein VH157_04705 [Bryobacteraceae bacterium]|jgi:hypothetical protein|nr:hypothetical protein [Bryobacteraceae bacterium]